MLAADPRVDVVSFTGSTATGRQVMARAAPTVKRVFLELGGKSATIVLDDADFSSALLAGLPCAITRVRAARSRRGCCCRAPLCRGR